MILREVERMKSTRSIIILSLKVQCHKKCDRDNLVVTRDNATPDLTWSHSHPGSPCLFIEFDAIRNSGHGVTETCTGNEYHRSPTGIFSNTHTHPCSG